ncbi:MAG: phosphatase PAP2 family protein [Bacteroidaceae bacterium]
MKGLLFLLAMCLVTPLYCQNIHVERSTDVFSVVPSVTGLCLAVVNKDKKGAIELALSTATTLAANYSLEAIIKKKRPDGSGNHAFPSTHTALAFDGASFIIRRYGWKWGIPAYVVSSYVAWGRTYSKKHDWWDVLGGAALGTGVALIYTRPFTRNVELSIAPALLGNDAKGICANIKF